MSNNIILKKSSVVDKVPLATDLQHGELALNFADGNLFFKTGSNTVATLASTKFVSVTGNVTANYFVGNGSQLTGLPEGYGNADVAAYLPTYTGNLVSLQGNVTTTANVSGNFFIGNGSQLTGIASGGISWTTQANAAPAGPAPGDFWYDAYTGVKYQYINDGTSNIWVDQSFPTSFGTLSVAGDATIGDALAVTGNITGGNLLPPSDNTGVVGTAALTWTNGHFTNLTVDSTLNVRAAIDLADNDILRFGSSDDWEFFHNGTSNFMDLNVGDLIIRDNTTTRFTFGRTTGNLTAVNFLGVASSAKYADLAEIYTSDHEYTPGTVVVFGGTHEVTTSELDHDTRVAGVVSTAPAYLMNSQAVGVPVALTGRVPCCVQGPVDKGDQLVNIGPGLAGRINFAHYRPGCVIGKSLESIADDSVRTIEIAVGRY